MALLAFDPDQPTRILSTDKKAQKAGGLCLALKGVPVKPKQIKFSSYVQNKIYFNPRPAADGSIGRVGHHHRNVEQR